MGYYYDTQKEKEVPIDFFFFLLSNFTHAAMGAQTPNLDQHLTMAISGGGAK